jgi:hypothetical protein
MNEEVQVKKAAPMPSAILFREDAEKGFENIRQESLALPILKLYKTVQEKHKSVIKIT